MVKTESGDYSSTAVTKEIVFTQDSGTQTISISLAGNNAGGYRLYLTAELGLATVAEAEYYFIINWGQWGRYGDFPLSPVFSRKIFIIFVTRYSKARPAVMSDGLLRLVGGCLAALDFLENLIKLLKNGLRQKFFVLPYCFLETQPTNHLSYNKSVEKWLIPWILAVKML